MTMKKTILLALAGAVAAVAPAFALRPAPRPAKEKQDYKYTGIASCSTKDCHGAEMEKGSPGLDEYFTWKNKDPHAKTFTTLYKAPSKAMGKAMTPPELKVTDSKRCLSCHTKVVDPAQTAPNAKWSVQNGVSCEVCHGPAEKWLMPHATPKESNWSHAKSVEVGMKDLRHLPTWAKDCASCHLQIEHDLVTAGHPKLLFELVDYNARTGAHWQTKNHPSMQPGFDAQAWSIGQVISLAEAIRNLNEREKTKAPGPRLKEAADQIMAHSRLLLHVPGFTPHDPALGEEAAKAVEAQAAKIPPGDAALLAKFAAEAPPKEFMAARQLALAFRAVSTKPEAKADIDKLCNHIQAKNEPKFDAAAFAADFSAVAKHFK